MRPGITLPRDFIEWIFFLSNENIFYQIKKIIEWKYEYLQNENILIESYVLSNENIFYRMKIYFIEWKYMIEWKYILSNGNNNNNKKACQARNSHLKLLCMITRIISQEKLNIWLAANLELLSRSLMIDKWGLSSFYSAVRLRTSKSAYKRGWGGIRLLFDEGHNIF